ncbi:FadR/GntR family transcriptional regulator [Rhodobium gokarnense]|uniref:DNA-binding FadR family transcriptional regulator n=1 Tax=Rhodobium gokarnense TaxID=364296 RepID=A0ABT3HDK4_9HYPH|nr:FadR/GntR family transcriptional regulator [Rhodobium gokarnense]MCW2308490.1 DNA-binding FadR family transcriptional regulator [Rhodobium gokarnense]
MQTSEKSRANLQTQTAMPVGAGPTGRSGNSADIVFHYLRGRIEDGTLAAGDRLPPERDLAALLGMSRPVLREALRALEMIGVVAIRQGSGTVLCRPDASSLAEFFTFALLQDVPVTEDVMEARIAVECQAGRLACERATISDINALRAAVEEIERTIDDPEAGARADHAFHSELVAAAHSPVLTALYATLADLLQRNHVDRRRSIPATDAFRAYVVDDHRRILTTLVDRKAKNVDAVLRRHFAIGNEFRDAAARQEILGLWSV